MKNRKRKKNSNIKNEVDILSQDVFIKEKPHGKNRISPSKEDDSEIQKLKGDSENLMNNENNDNILQKAFSVFNIFDDDDMEFSKTDRVRFFEACSDGNLEMVKRILDLCKYKKGVKNPRVKALLQIENSFERNALHQSCYYGNVQIVKFLTSIFKVHGLDIDEMDIHNENPLMLACLRGYKKSYKRIKNINTITNRCKIVKILLDHGSNLSKNYLKQDDANPLHWACYYGDYGLAKLLLTKEFELYKYYNQEHQFPIDYCILERKAKKFAPSDAAIALLIVSGYIQRELKKQEKTILSKNITFDRNGKVKKDTAKNFALFKDLERDEYSSIFFQIFKFDISKGSTSSEDKDGKDSIDSPQFTEQNEDLEDLGWDEDEEDIFPSKKPPIQQIKTDRKDNTKTLLKKTRKFEQKFTISQRSYQIPYLNTKVKDDLLFQHRMMYFCVVFGQSDYIKIFLEFKTSPFVPCYEEQNCIHAACYHGRPDILKMLFSNNYIFPNKKKMTLKQKIEQLNLQTGIGLQSPLHLAIQQAEMRTNQDGIKYMHNKEVINYLLIKKAEICLFNTRGWTPFQMTRVNKIQQLETETRKILNDGDSLAISKRFFEESTEYLSEYQYCIITSEEKYIQYNIIYDQLLQIQEFYQSQNKGWLYVKVMRGWLFIRKVIFLGFFNKEKIGAKGNKTYFLLHLDNQLLDILAEQIQVQVYNRKKGFLEPFLKARQEQYEIFKQTQIQQILRYILTAEFDVDYFRKEKIIINDFPLHNFSQRKNIAVQLKKTHWAQMFDIITPKTNRSALAPLNAITIYYGSKVDIQFQNKYFSRLDGTSLFFIHYQACQFQYPFQELYVWISIWATLFIEKWKQRQNEMKITWDLHHFEQKDQKNPKYHGDNIVDENTEMIDTQDYFPTWKRRLLTDTPLILTALVFIVINDGFIQWLQVQVTESISPEDDPWYTWIKQTSVGSLNGILISIFNEIYYRIVKKFVGWENHKFLNIQEDSIVIKIFTFQFVNSYITLFTTAFLSFDKYNKYQSLIVLRSQFVSLMLSKTIVNLINTSIKPMFEFFGKNYFYKKRFIKRRNKICSQSIINQKKNMKDLNRLKYSEDTDGTEGEFIKDMGDINPDQKLDFDDELFLIEQIERTQVMNRRNSNMASYTNLAILFGYVAMFSTVDPLSPLICFLCLQVQVWADGYGLSRFYKRTEALQADGIGIWNEIFTVLTYASTLFNTAILYHLQRHHLEFVFGQNCDTSYPQGIDKHKEDIHHYLIDTKKDSIDYCMDNTNFLLCIGLIEHFLLVMKIFLAYQIDDVPQWVDKFYEKEVVRQDTDKNKAVRIQRNLSIKNIELEKIKDKVKQDPKGFKIIQNAMKILHLPHLKKMERRQSKRRFSKNVQKPKKSKKYRK